MIRVSFPEAFRRIPLAIQNRSRQVLDRLTEGSKVVLFACLDDNKIKVGSFETFEAAADRVDLMEEAYSDQEDEDLKGKGPEDLVKGGFWPQGYKAEAQLGSESYAYDGMRWTSL